MAKERTLRSLSSWFGVAARRVPRAGAASGWIGGRLRARPESIRHAASVRHGRGPANSQETRGLVPRTDLAYDSGMKLVPKLAAALIAGTFAVLVPNGYLRVQREVAVLRSDRVRDHALLGRSLGAAVSALWRTGGRTEALAIVEGVNARGGGVHVRWVDDGTGPYDASALQDLASGESLTRIVSSPAGMERETYVPVSVAGVRAGMIELTEPLEVEERAARRIAIDTVGTTLALAFVSGALSVVLGFWLVGRPGAYTDLHLDRLANELQTPAEYVMDSRHGGSEGWDKSFLEVAPDTVSVLAIKQAEDSSGAMILRIQERSGKHTVGRVESSLLKLSHDVPLNPRELKTLRIESSKQVKAKVREVSTLET